MRALVVTRRCHNRFKEEPHRRQVKLVRSDRAIDVRIASLRIANESFGKVSMKPAKPHPPIPAGTVRPQRRRGLSDPRLGVYKVGDPVRSVAAVEQWRAAQALAEDARAASRAALKSMVAAGMSRQTIAYETGISLSTISRRLRRRAI